MTRFGGRLEMAAEVPTTDLRAELLTVKGVGPETADSILLYALARPVFVIDAYTHRVWKRHGLAAPAANYAALQALALAQLLVLMILVLLLLQHHFHLQFAVAVLVLRLFQ